MAAYYAWLTGRGITDEAEGARALLRAKRLAPRATERERLLIEGSVAMLEAPLTRTVAIAETLSVRYPDDPDAQTFLGQARFAEGDWARSVAAYEQAVGLDSIAGAIRGSYCRVCTALNAMSHTYLWWDSAGAAERSARRLIALRPEDKDGWGSLVEPLLRQGRRAEAEAAIERALALSYVLFPTRPNFDRDRIRWGQFDQLDAELRADLRSPSRASRDEAHWLLVLSLRDQGRIREAHTFAVDPSHHALLAMEMGRSVEAANLFQEQAKRAWGTASAPPAFRARVTTWMLSLAGTARAAAGDTAVVHRLADSLEALGTLSSFGRDARLHWILRGLLLQRDGRHAEAVEAFRRGMFSTSDGYTLTNLFLAKSLMVTGRPLEAIAVLRPAIRGGVDGSNSYVSRTELHEALAQAFDMAGLEDSATAHYRAVARAWSRADPPYRDRVNRARAKAGQP
jgi:tetratricopeptide (TPR) repeat protein